MGIFIKITVLSIFLTSFSSCGEEEETLNARKRPRSSSTRVFEGGFQPAADPSVPCPSGDGAEVTVNFTSLAFNFKMPETDTSDTFSAFLQEANNTKLVEGTHSIDRLTGDIQATFIFDDADNQLGDAGCVASGDTYALRARLNFEGKVKGSIISQATYSITSVCTSDNASPVVCSGTFTGTEKISN